MTDGSVHLDQMLLDYQRAWEFFRQNLYRRSNPEQIAIELLSYCYHPYNREGLGDKRQNIYAQVVDSGIDVPLLVLMLMKAMPGYDSKDGDVTEMPLQYERVMQLMERFVANSQMFNLMPVVTRARDEENKCRLMLYHHVSRILNTYESYTLPGALYDMANAIKDSKVHLDIEGFWNEYGGQLLYTDFWQIEDDDAASGTYFGRRGESPWIIPMPPSQNILAQRNSCPKKVLPLQHGKETFIIRLRDVGALHASQRHS